jgi:DNA-binding response OmpR family regulator
MFPHLGVVLSSHSSLNVASFRAPPKSRFIRLTTTEYGMSTKRLALIIGDDGETRRLAVALQTIGYQVQESGGIPAAALADAIPFLVVLRLTNRSADDLKAIRHLSTMPKPTIIVLSDSSDTVTRTQAFQCGADDYITPPFSVNEILERIRIRTAANCDSFVWGGTFVDLRLQLIVRDDRRISITRQEVRVLRVLLAHAGQTVSRQRLLQEAWGFKTLPQTRRLDYIIKRLREKLGADVAITTVRGVGFTLQSI